MPDMPQPHHDLTIRSDPPADTTLPISEPTMTTGHGLTAKYRKLRPQVLARDGYRCLCPGCGKCDGWCKRRAGTVDHIRPRLEGGTDTLANLRACCLSCNSSLGARTAHRHRNRHPFFLFQPLPSPAPSFLSPPTGAPPKNLGTKNHDRIER
jgi:hypothetical protein